MNHIRNRILAAGLIIMLVLSGLAATTIHASAKASLNQTKVTVEVGRTKIIRVKNAGKKVSTEVVSGKKNVSVAREKNSIKITGKKQGAAKLQVRTGGRKLICRITVKGKNNASAAKGYRIAVESGTYTIVYQLNGSQAAKELYAQLPLILDVENFSNNEKIFYPPKKLTTDGAPGSVGKKGSLAYYAPWGDVVMFYEAGSSASGLYELGTVVSGENDISKLSGKITVSKAD